MIGDTETPAVAVSSSEMPPEYALNDDVILIPLPDGTVRLLDMCGEFYALPEAGGVILQATLERGTEAAVKESAERFAVEPTQVRVDLTTLVEELQRKGALYRPAAGGPPRQRWRRALATMLLVLAAPIARLHFFSLETRAWAMLTAARASFAWCKWTATVETWERWWRPPHSSPPVDQETIAKTIDDAVRAAAARHWLRCECKERSICCWALARAAGLPAKLVIGVQLFPFAGHCWCESESRVLSDDRANTEMYTPVARYS